MADVPYPAGGEVATKEAARLAFEAAHVECDELSSFRLEEKVLIERQVADLERELKLKTMALEEIKLDQPAQAARCPAAAVKAYGKWWVPK